jgi:PBP1b-binding outer membrane lipoprotein LpoB
MGDKMTKMSIIVLMSITLLLSGCGYKAPPYYEKPSKEVKNVAV